MNKKLIRQVFILFLFFIVNVVCVFPASRAEAKLTAKEKKFFRKVIADEFEHNKSGHFIFHRSNLNFTLMDVDKDGKEELFICIYHPTNPGIVMNEVYRADKKSVKTWQYNKKGKLKLKEDFYLSDLESISSKAIRTLKPFRRPILDSVYYTWDKKGKLVRYAEVSAIWQSWDDWENYKKADLKYFNLKGKEVSEKEFKKAVKKLGKFKEVKYHEASKKNIKKYLGGK